MSACIYVSFAHPDQAFAAMLRDRLRVEGYEVCEGDESVENAAILLAVTSPASVASEGVIRELQAFPGHRKAVIPVIPPTAPHGTLDWIPHYLALIDLVDFAADDEETAFQKLLAILGPPPERTRRIGDAEDDTPSFLRRIPTGIPVILLLVAALVAAFALPEGSPIPRPVGFGMILLGVIGGVFLLGTTFRHTRQESVKKKRLRIPDAFIEIIETGRRYEIKSAHTNIGRQSGNHIRLARRGVGAQQCRIIWDQHDEAFYLETSDAKALTTLHDQILEPERPLPIGNGDIVMLADQVVIQFRLGKVR